MELLPTTLFVGNVALVITDAAVAYQMAPHFVAAFSADPDDRIAGVKRLRSFLPLLVALYVILDCQAYALRHPGYLGALSLILVADIAVQLLVARRHRRMADGGE